MKRSERETALHKTLYKSYIIRQESKICNLFDAYWFGEMISAIERLAPKKPSIKLLDLGCGTCLFFKYLKDNPRIDYLGVDISEEMLDVARKAYGSYPHFRALRANLDTNFGVEEDFDVYCMRGFIHHLEHKDAFLDSMINKIPSGSLVIISEPGRNIITHLLREILKKFKRNHFDADHVDLKESYFVKKFRRPDTEILEIKYLGYLSFPFSFPDILRLPMTPNLMKILIAADRVISKIPLLQHLSWHIIYVVRKK